MGDIFDYVEVVIHTCTGDTTVLKFDDGTIVDSRRNADQAASTVRVIARSGKDLRWFKDDEDWFRSFPDWAHITHVSVFGRNHLSGDAMPYEVHTFRCAHTAKITSEGVTS